MPAPAANLIRKLDELNTQYQSLGDELLRPEVQADHRQVRQLAMRQSAIEGLVEQYRTWRDIQNEIAECRMALTSSDRDLVQLAKEELPGLESRGSSIMESIERELVTAEDRSVGSVMLEVRSGVGGDEAALWAGDLLEMYRRFAQRRGWRFEELEFKPGDAGGLTHITVNVAGPGVWSLLGYEGGTHQVKRVPATEAQGRVHTSTATVAVLPEPEEVDSEVPTSEVREIMTTAQGPGGQNVNKVATAVHLIHEPTGIEVRMQETRSQGQNREKAWRLLRARVHERRMAQAAAERREQRRSMIGSGERAEKIRTYRYKENVAVDQRVDGSYNLASLLGGEMEPLLEALAAKDIAERLERL